MHNESTKADDNPCSFEICRYFPSGVIPENARAQRADNQIAILIFQAEVTAGLPQG